MKFNLSLVLGIVTMSVAATWTVCWLINNEILAKQRQIQEISQNFERVCKENERLKTEIALKVTTLGRQEDPESKGGDTVITSQDVVVDTKCKEFPYDGNTCIKMSFWEKHRLGSVSFQIREKLEKKFKICFYARGEKGDEVIEVKMNGILIHEERLQKDWLFYEMDIPLSSIEKLTFAFTKAKNPNGAVIFLDKIILEKVLSSGEKMSCIPISD